MRRISLRGSFFFKRAVLLLWFGVYASFGIHVYSAISKGKAHFLFIVIPISMAVLAYLIMKPLWLDYVDEVWDVGDALIIKNQNRQDRIPLSEITNVCNINDSDFRDQMLFSTVTLTLKKPCRFGKEVTFLTKSGYIPFRNSPIADELLKRIGEQPKGE